jgi:hypothetical protein
MTPQRLRVTQLPPGCSTGCVTATATGAYPQVWNNVLADPSFGVTSRVYLDQLTTPRPGCRGRRPPTGRGTSPAG